MYYVCRIKFYERSGKLNTQKLQGKIKERGYTLKTLSKALKLSTATLFNKVHGKREFLCSEIQNISNLLNLSATEVKDIFFINIVE